MSTGEVKYFNEKRGYGFIKGSDGKEIFIHCSSIAGEGYKCLEEGQAVTYDVAESDRGPQAINVNLLD